MRRMGTGGRVGPIRSTKGTGGGLEKNEEGATATSENRNDSKNCASSMGIEPITHLEGGFGKKRREGFRHLGEFTGLHLS